LWLFVTGRPAPRIRVTGDATIVAHLQRIICSVPTPTS